ncbi:hypothetical protein [Planotetraspora kaengkrachanensis]|uniref:Uncharacterized protein n=1 Tax=Planotetraspora kaengkrachanensis TaxID=575193 RepID=A0A8J3PXT2_9ACTN|nr:hypothetical protein [Planotetraspora kaengkrachanensis]GIG82955.1 hypothetical protein Pka01_60820 [Planotetraspora kaengkrachanensis]
MTSFQDALDAAVADPGSPAWDLIWQESCDQGTCDPASAVLLPWLARTCANFSPQDRERAVVLAGFIAVDADEKSRGLYADNIATLRALTLECLASGGSSDTMFVYLQQAVLGFDGDEVWGKELDRINDGEVDVQCPACAEDLLIDLQPVGSSIEAGLSSQLATRLHAEASRVGHESVVTALTYLFGRMNCPACGATFNVADEVTGSYPR